MILGLISDIHGNAPALDIALKHMKPRVDKILFAGDFAGYYPFVNECIEMMPADILGVRGNHDEILINYIRTGQLPGDYLKKYGSALKRCADSLSETSIRMLSGLPLRQDIKIDEISIMLVHGSPWDPLNGRVYPDFSDWERFNNYHRDIVILGHTHYSLKKKIGSTLILNPGSVGQTRDKKKGVCFAELNISQDVVHFYQIPYNPHQVIEDARIHDPENTYLVKVLK